MDPATRVHGIRQVAITVADVDAALGFYRDALGLAFLFRAGPELAFLGADGVRIMLTTPQGAGVVGANSIVYFRVHGIAATHVAMLARGAAGERGRTSLHACPTTSCGRRSCATPTATWSG